MDFEPRRYSGKRLVECILPWNDHSNGNYTVKRTLTPDLDMWSD